MVLPVILSALAMLAGCGSSASNPVAPPQGGFKTSNLNGTYVFSSTGTDGGNFFLTMAGTFTADGNGGISGGTVDMNDAEFSAPLVNQAITGGNYSVTADGRGKIKLNTTTPFGSSIGLAFVLSSSSHGLVSEFDANGSGSGTLDLQSAVTQSQLAGKYVFNLSGTAGINTITGAGIPMAAVGLVTLDASGNATGTQDLNIDSTPSSQNILSPSNVLVGSSPGTASIVTSGGTFGFDVFPIDSTHLKMIEVDGISPILVGDVFSQTSSSFPANGLVFTMAGLDYSVSPAVPLVVAGQMNSDGTSAIGNGVEDVNDAGSITTTPLPFTGSFTASGNRYLLTLNNFGNGAGGALGNFTFAAYPSSGGLQLVEIDGGGSTGGVAYSQTNTSFASGEGYGLNLTAVNVNGFEEDDIAEFTNTNNNLKGLIDVNDQGSTSTPQTFNGTYSADSANAGRGTITSNAFNLAAYTVDNTTTVIIELDSNQLGLGAIAQQAAPSQAALAARLAVAVRPRVSAHKMWRKRM